MGKLAFSDKIVLFIGSNLVGTVMTLGWGVLLVRYLTKYEFGTFQQIMLLRVTIQGLVLMGLHQSLFYFIPKAKNDDAKKGIIIQNFFLLALVGAIIAGGCYMLAPVFAESFNNPSLAAYAGIYSLFFIFDTPVMMSKAVFLSLDKVNLTSVVNVASALTLILATVVPAELGYDFRAMLMGILIVYIMKFIGFSGYILSLPGGVRGAFDFSTVIPQFKYSLPLGISAMPDAFKRQLDKFVISGLYTPDQFAVYSRGAFEMPFVSDIPYSMNHILLPRYVKSYEQGDYKTLLYLWNESIRRMALLFFPLFVFTFIFAEKFITFLYTDAYAESASIFQVYLCLLPFRLVGYRVILRAVGDTRQILVATIVSLSVNIGLNFALATSFGFYGPAVSFLAGEISGIAYLFFAIKRVLKFPVMELLPVRSLVSTFIVSAVIGTGFIPYERLDLPKFITLASAGAMFFIAYVAVMRWARLFSDADWDLIMRWATLKVLRDRVKG
ncbi:MAG: oligosaccharide flippase family protein [Deltaproteobacteria bacterium]